MSTRLESKDIEQLLAQADELIQRINSDSHKEMKEEHLLQFKMHAQKLKKLKSEVQGRIETKETSKTDYGAEGFHEAIVDIVAAMQDLTKFLT